MRGAIYNLIALAVLDSKRYKPVLCLSLIICLIGRTGILSGGQLPKEKNQVVRWPLRHLAEGEVTVGGGGGWRRRCVCAGGCSTV